MKRILPVLLAAALIFSLGACSVSSSSTSTTTITTSTTDADGNTTTNTTTTEMGVTAGTDGVSTTHNTTTTTTTETPAPADEAAPTAADYVEALSEKFTDAATGSNDSGDTFYYLWREDGDDVYAALMIVGADDSIYAREGWIQTEENNVALVDEELDSVTPFYFDNNDDNGSFDMCFVQDGDVAHMATADTDDVIAAVSEVLANIQG